VGPRLEAMISSRLGDSTVPYDVPIRAEATEPVLRDAGATSRATTRAAADRCRAPFRKCDTEPELGERAWRRSRSVGLAARSDPDPS
jgi:hypothetical protein